MIREPHEHETELAEQALLYLDRQRPQMDTEALAAVIGSMIGQLLVRMKAAKVDGETLDLFPIVIAETGLIEIGRGVKKFEIGTFKNQP